MRIYVIFLSLLISFAPVYSYAVLPVLGALSGSTAGRVVVSKAGGAVVRKIPASTIAQATKAAVSVCAKNPLAFAFCTTVISAIKGDKWNITLNTGDNNDTDVEIYKNIEYSCRIDTYGSPAMGQYISISSALSIKKNNLIQTQAANGYVFDRVHSDTQNEVETKLNNYIQANYDTLMKTLSDNQRSGYSQINQTYIFRKDGSGTLTRSISIDVGYFKNCSNPLEKIYITQQEINNYFNKFSDDDIRDIYNYDFSQHNNIKINNEVESGESINNKIKNDVEYEKDISDDAAKKSRDKNPNYHPDKINEQNCSKDVNGKLDKCGSDREDNPDDSCPAGYIQTDGKCLKKDSPEDENKDCPVGTVSVNGYCVKPDDNDDLAPEDERPAECNSNQFYRKICDWIDWTQEEPTEPNDEKPGIKEVEAENSNKIDMSGSCPAPYQINFSVFGHSQNNSISYQPLCDALEMLKPIFVGAGALSSMFILMGYSRPNSTGVND